MEVEEPFLPRPLPIGMISPKLSVGSPLSSINKARAVGAALYNMGNTCFLNSVLQCITHTVPLVQKLRDADHSTCSDDGEDFCSLCALRTHVNNCMVMSGHILTPKNFAYNLSKISPYLSLGDQEDAHEFLHCLLDKLHTCCLGPSSKDQPSSSEEDSIVKEVFGGRLKNQLRCSSCGHCKDTYETSLDISLEIDDVENLTDALKSFTKSEKIDDYTCEGCNAQGSIEKKYTLDEAPEVIALHLKRFKNNGSFIEKVDKFVKYPLDLDLRPFLSSPEGEEQSEYELYAIVMHYGALRVGHYLCTVRTSPSEWYQMNDSKVLRISDESDVLDRDAYILFYIKKGSSPWFSSFMESLKLPDLSSCELEFSPISVLDQSGRSLSSSTGETSSSNSTSETTPSPPHLLEGSPEPIVAVNVEGNRPMVEGLQTPDHAINVFHDELVEDDEKDNDLIPQVVVSRSVGKSREAVRPALESMDIQARASFQMTIGTMPISRRLKLMECYTSQKKQHLTRSEPIANKRQRKTRWDQKSGSGTSSRQCLSPSSIRRGLFPEL